MIKFLKWPLLSKAVIVLGLIIVWASAAYSQSADIFEAVRSGDIEQVKEILIKDPKAATISISQRITPLHQAIKNGNKDIADLLILKGADINAVSNYGRTPLTIAVNKGRKDIVESLIAKGAEINFINIYGQTALSFAALKGNIDIAELLLDKGAEINSGGKGNNPLHSASKYGHKKMVEYFLSKGADINAGVEGQTPLNVVAESNRKDMVLLLIENGADVKIAGNTLLHSAAKKDNKDLVKLFLANGLDINGRNKGGETPLHCAAKFGEHYEERKDLVELLLKNGADVNARGNNGITALHYAAREGRREVAEHLIAKGADVNVKTDNGLTPLHYGARGEYCDHEVDLSINIVKLLLEKGANPNVSSTDGWTPLLYAAAANPPKENVIKLLVSVGADANARNKDGGTVFNLLPYWAVGITEYLIANGAKGGGKSKQEEAKGYLKNIYHYQTKYLKDKKNHELRFNSLNFRPIYHNRYAYFLLNDEFQSDIGGPYQMSADVKKYLVDEAFLAMAISNIDNDPTLDVWMINKNGDLINLVNDIEN